MRTSWTKLLAAILSGVFAVNAVGCAMDDSPTTSGASDELASVPWTVARASSDESSPAKSNFASADFSAQPDAIKPRVSLSFFGTCINPSAQGVGNVATHAQADACRRHVRSVNEPPRGRRRSPAHGCV